MEQAEQENLPKPLGPEDQCDSNPEFAVICSFINKFGSNIDLQLNLIELKDSIENQDKLEPSLVDIHVKLLKKLRRYFVRDQWEKALIKYAYEYSYEDGYEIETSGYLKTRPSVKLQLLRRLLDAQFECDPKFKAAVNLLEAGDLRLKPAGRDVEGNTYWPCTDEHGSLRIYREEPLQHKSWLAICKNADDLKQLIEHLDATKDKKVKGEPQPEPYNPYPEIFPEYFIKDEPLEEESAPIPRKGVKKGGKKGKNKGRYKKLKPLSTVPEIDEPTIQDIKPSTIEQIKEGQPRCDNDLLKSTSSDGSVESHVKYTIENIITKVVSSFDYIFKRSSPDVKKETHVEPEKNVTVQESKIRGKRKGKVEKPKPEELPRRSSSRIQQLQQKKEEEEAIKRQQSKIIAESLIETGAKELSSKNCIEKHSKRDKKDKIRWRSSKTKKKLSWDKDDSDLSSTSSLSESNDDESFMEALNDETNHDNDDDEFACEDEETNDEPVIIKRARTARQTLELEDTSVLNGSSITEEDKPCGRCDKSNDPDWILLCDMCDYGYHTACCVPPLMYVPDGDWYCPICEQKMLTQKLKELCDSVVELLATRERERMKRQKLRQQAPKKDTCKINLEENGGDKRQRDVLNELNNPMEMQIVNDDMVSSVSEHELPSSYRERSTRLPKKKMKKKKKTKRERYESEEDDDEYEYTRRSKKTYSRNILDSESEEEEFDDEAELSDEEYTASSSDNDEQLKTRRARAFVSYKFEEYDELIQSAICGDSDAEVPNRAERPDTAETCNIGRGKDMATIEALAYQQENGLIIGESNPAKQTKQRRKGRKLNDLDAESEIDIATSDESFQASSATEDMDEEEEDDVTEISSEEESSIDEIVSMYRPKSKKHKKDRKRKRYDSDDSDFKPRSRRAAAQKVSYKESTDEEEEADEDDPLVSNVEPEPVTRNPINELSQYCNETSHPSEPLFSSFKMSPTHPQFYKEDEVRSLPTDIDK